MNKHRPLVSVVIPTRNAGSTLNACLESIRRQEYPRVETVVVDDHSTDETRKIAKMLADRVVTTGGERSAQRNAGAAESRGDYLLFVDADMELAPELIDELVGVLIEHPSVMVPVEDRGPGFWHRVRGFERSMYLRDPDIEAIKAVRRDVFEQVRGFDKRLWAGEDWDLSARVLEVSGPPGRISKPLLHYEEAVTLRQTYRKRKYYGRSFHHYLKKRRESGRSNWAIWFRMAYFRHANRFIRHPLLGAGLVILKLVEAAGILAGMREVRRGQVVAAGYTESNGNNER